MASPADVVLLPDAGPLITLAYADALDVLHKPAWSVALVDMVLHEVTRSHTPTSEKIAQWAARKQVPILPTEIFARYQQLLATQTAQNLGPRKSNLGELAIQEAMNGFALAAPSALPKTGIFLFEDHKIARKSFVLPDNCSKISTRAFLLFLEQKGLIDSAAQIERLAIQAGRAFSSLRFPP